MRIALIGSMGQLGTALGDALGEPLVSLTHRDIELSDSSGVEASLSKVGPDCVINAAAYNFVDRAEEEPAEAFAINALGPRNLAAWCARSGALLVHVSTDYVYGSGQERTIPYRESDPPSPACSYALSKLWGETLVRSICPRHFIVRTCGLYGRSRSEGKGNFVKTVLRLAGQRDELTIVNDQRCTPSFAADIAAAIARLVQSTDYGLYHATNSGSATWYDFACEIVRIAGLNVRVKPVTSAEYPQKAVRPRYSVLDCRKLASAIGHPLPPWQDALARYLAEGTDLQKGASR